MAGYGSRARVPRQAGHGADPTIAKLITEQLKVTGGRIGYEDGISVYTPEGYLTRYEHALLQEHLPGAELVDAHALIDRVSLISQSGPRSLLEADGPVGAMRM